jgi:hypothetical protein
MNCRSVVRFPSNVLNQARAYENFVKPVYFRNYTVNTASRLDCDQSGYVVFLTSHLHNSDFKVKMDLCLRRSCAVRAQQHDVFAISLFQDDGNDG